MVAGLCLVTVVTAGCGDDGGGSGEPAQTTAATVAPTTSLVPVKGGSITIGVSTETSGFDPASAQASGSTGGIEMTALYDTIMRWNPDAKKFEGRTAQSLEPNADFTEYNLKLKPGVKFTDGTAYDAEAVKANIDRHITPTSRSGSRGVLQQFLQSMTVVEPLTLKFTLKQSWPAFPFVLTQTPGMIASPTAIQKAGANFNTAPGNAGAGPFQLGSYRPQESIVMTRNPTFYGGDVYLDQVTFVPGTSGESGRLDALNAGTMQAIVLRTDPVVIAQAKAKYPSIDRPIFGGNAILMNAGVEVVCQGGKPDYCAGKPDGTKVQTPTPTTDVRVRKAVVAAVDPAVVNEKVWAGKGLAGSALVTSAFPWDPAVPAPKYDLNEAKRLVQEAKTAGWNGKIRLLVANDPVQQQWGLTVKTSLELAGMSVDLSSDKAGPAVIQQVLTNHDFDLANWSYSLSDDDGSFSSLFSSLQSANVGRYGYKSTEMDTAIDDLRKATTDDAKRAAWGKISQIFYRDAPGAIIATAATSFVHIPKLRGFQQSATAIVMLDKVWLGQ